MGQLATRPLVFDVNGNPIPVPRRLPRAAPTTQFLSQRHLEIITQHLAGLNRHEIAARMGISSEKVTEVLRMPKAQDILARAKEDWRMELEALSGQVVSNLREGLSHADFDTRLKTTDRFLKARAELIPDKDRGRETAEDVAAKILQAIQINGKHIQMNFNGGGKDGD